MRIGYVEAEKITTRALSRDDLGVAGLYEVEWIGEGPAPDSENLGDVLLEVFANNVPVSEPEDFDVTPLDTDKEALSHEYLPGELGTLHVNLSDWRITRVS